MTIITNNYELLNIDSQLLINLREVGVPSRNILHGRGRVSKSRFRLGEVVRVAGAQKVSKKVTNRQGTANFALFRDPLFLAPRMRAVMVEEHFQ